MSRQMFRNGGVVYMEEGGAAPVPSQEEAEIARIKEMIRQNDGRLPGPYGYEKDEPRLENLPYIPDEKEYDEIFLMSDPPIRVRTYKDGRVERVRMPRSTGIMEDLMQKYQNGGPVYMAGGGVVDEFAAVFASGDTNAFINFFIENEDELRDEARRTRNPSLVNMIKLIEKMESADADAAIAETQRLSEMPQTGMIEVPAPGGSTYMKDPRPFKGETLQRPINLETFFQEYRQTPTTPPQPQTPQQPGMMGEVPMQYFQEGGMAMPAPMPAAPGPEGIASLPNKAAMEAMPVEGVAQEATQVGLDPAVVQQMLGEVDSTLGDLENAESYEDVINGIREADAPIEARYKELAGFVGEEDAMRTPESVLTMLQPVIMMAGVDQGIGALASEEMTAPVTGDMAGGIMSTVNMGQEGVPPVNFNLGGAVQYFAPANENRVAGAMPGGRLGELYGEKRDLYRSIMGKEDQQAAYDEQKDLTQAQMLFDIAQGALGFAAGSGMPGRSPAEQLAAAASPVLGNISQRAGELAKFKQAQAKEARSMDLAALTAAEAGLTAEQKAASDLAKQRLIGAQDLAKLNLKSRLDTNREAYVEQLKQRGSVTLEGVKQANRLGLEAAQQRNREAIETLKQSGSQADIVLADDLRKQNLQISHELKLNEMGIANTYELGKLDKMHEQTSELQNSRLAIQEKIADNRLAFDKLRELTRTAEAEKAAALAQKRYDLAEKAQDQLNSYRDEEIRLKQEDLDFKKTASDLDIFGKSLTGKVKSYLEGKGSAELAARYAAGQTSLDENNRIEGSINYLTSDKSIYDNESQSYIRQPAQPLVDVWANALKERKKIKGASLPQVEKNIENSLINAGLEEQYTQFKTILDNLGDLDPSDVSGRNSLLIKGSNVVWELAFGSPAWAQSQAAQDFVKSLNNLTVQSIVRAMPGKSAADERKKIEDNLPPVASLRGGETVKNQTKFTIAQLDLALKAADKQPFDKKTRLSAIYELQQLKGIYERLLGKLEAYDGSSSDVDWKQFIKQ